MDLYSEIILDHFKNPHNKERLKNPSGSAEEHNTSCGDKIQLDLEIDQDGKIIKVGWDGEGCAISQAAASMLSDELIGKNVEKVKDISNDFIFDLLKVEISPGRAKCALLGLVTAKKAAILSKNSKK